MDATRGGILAQLFNMLTSGGFIKTALISTNHPTYRQTARGRVGNFKQKQGDVYGSPEQG